MDYFAEKAHQISNESMLAFGVPVLTRYGRASEMAEMLMFMQYAAARGLHTLVKEVFYDSQACVCTIELHDPQGYLSQSGLALRECAQRAIRQFDWDGTIGHGASLLDSDEFPA